jgi:hypothetical protein
MNQLNQSLAMRNQGLFLMLFNLKLASLASVEGRKILSDDD